MFQLESGPEGVFAYLERFSSAPLNIFTVIALTTQQYPATL